MDARLNFHFPALPVPEADFIIIELFQFTLPFQAKRTCLPFLFPPPYLPVEFRQEPPRGT